MSQPFLGMIINGAYTFAPRGFAACDGQTLAIAQNLALFSLLGTIYGGNGQSTFNLPDLRGQVVLHRGQSSGTDNYAQGQSGGVEQVTMTQATMPAHTHLATFAPSANLSAINVDGTTPNPTVGHQLAIAVDVDGTPSSKPFIYGPTTTSNPVTIDGPINIAGTVSVAPVGSNQAFPVVNPYNTIITCIATEGVFPSRN